MNRNIARLRCAAICVLLGLSSASAALADYADVVLRDGTVLRGDVEEQGGVILLRNAAGEVRLDRAGVARILPLEPPSSRPVVTPAGPESQPGEPQSGAPSVENGPVDGELEAPAEITERDIQRIRLSEMDHEAEPERVRVSFSRAGDEAPLEDVVLAEIAEMEEPEPQWRDVLTRGRPHEKLAVILEATGLKYADRIELRSETRVFDDYRKRVLPNVIKGCGRSGCHSGEDARVFRLPEGSRASESYTFVSFLILDGLRTKDGLLIDHEFPGHSILAQYLLARDEAETPHPEVERGRVAPVFNSRRDRRYQELIDWIASLRDVRPDYGLEYALPDWTNQRPDALENPKKVEAGAPD